MNKIILLFFLIGTLISCTQNPAEKVAEVSVGDCYTSGNWSELSTGNKASDVEEKYFMKITEVNSGAILFELHPYKSKTPKPDGAMAMPTRDLKSSKKIDCPKLAKK